MTLREQISALIKQGKLTQAKLARETGVNSGALSAWMNDKYKGNVETLEMPIKNWLALVTAKLRYLLKRRILSTSRPHIKCLVVLIWRAFCQRW